MAQANISLLSTTVIDSYSSQDSANPWSNILDGYTSTNGRSSYGNLSNQWIIIDLGSIWPLVGFKVWNSTLTPDSQGTQRYRIEISSTGTDDANFTEVVPLTYIYHRLLGTLVPNNAHAIPSTNARYVRLRLEESAAGHYAGAAPYIALSSFEIYSLTITTETKTRTSDAEIFSPTPTETILSDGFIYKPVVTDRINLTSNAQITDTKEDIYSDATIVDSLIFSDAEIVASESDTILSDAFIYRSGSFGTDLLMFGQANLVSGSHNMMIFTTDISASDEVIVDDMIVSQALDMTTVVPPVGYNNYDWKYDWVVRTYNKCQYKFEVRSAENLLDLSAETFHEIQLGEQINRGFVPRYHQWRCHVWASGSGDFELHQFTIKGYVNYPANPLYRALRTKPFITTSHVTAPSDGWTVQLYEPSLAAMAWTGPYLPGDMNADNNITNDDTNFLVAVLFGSLPESSVPSPGVTARGDWDGDGVVDSSDLSKSIAYIAIAGPPPLRYEEPS